MKINYLITLFVLISTTFTTLYSQVEIASFKPIVDNPKTSEFLSNVNIKGELAISYFYNNYLFLTVLNKDGKVLYKTQTKAPTDVGISVTEGLIGLGTLYENNKFFHFYIGGLHGNKNYILVTDLDTKKSILKITKISERKERFIGKVYDENNFYIVKQNGKDNTIIIYKFIKSSLAFQSKIFKVGYSIINLFKDGTLLNERFTGINYNEQVTPSKAMFLNKLYLSKKNEIIVTLNGWSRENHSTFIQFFNWETGKKESKPLGEGMSSKYPPKTNSFLFDDHFYYLFVTKDAFSLEVYDFNTFALINKFQYNSTDSEITLMKTNFFYVNGTLPMTLHKNQTSKILKTIKKGYSYIYLEKGEMETPIIFIGSHIVRAMGVGFMPNLGVAISLNTYDSTNQYFQTTFPDNKFEINKKEIPNDKYLYSNKIKVFKEDNLTSKHILSTIFFPKTASHGLIHYLKSENLIKVTQF